MYACDANEELGFCGAYGFNLGGWQGGQAEYMLVPWADFQLLKFPDKEQAMEKIRDLTLLSDILPTGYHGCVEARVGTGSTVYIAGAGPVGRCAAASAQLLGASCIIVGDHNKARLDLVKKAGYEVVDPSSDHARSRSDRKNSRHGLALGRCRLSIASASSATAMGRTAAEQRGGSRHQHADGSDQARRRHGHPRRLHQSGSRCADRAQQEGHDGLGLSRGLGQVADR